MLAQGLKKRGHIVDIYVFERDAQIYENLQQGLNIIVFESLLLKTFKKFALKLTSIPYCGTILNMISSMLASRSITKKYDIINCHNALSQQVAVFNKLLKNKQACVVWMCNDAPNILKPMNIRSKLEIRLDKHILKYIKKIIVLDAINNKRLKERYKCNSIIIRSGIDLSSYSSTYTDGNRIREKYSIKGTDIVVLTVGRLEKKEGIERRIDELIIACKKLSETRSVKLILVGTGNMISDLKKLVIKLNFKENVIFTGYVPEEELPNYYSACDVFVFTVWIQTWGLVVFEAMACKKPVLLSKYVGAAEVLKDCVNCVLLERLDADEIVEKINKLLDDPDYYNTIAINGFEFVKNNLSWDRYVESMESIFREVIDGVLPIRRET